MIFKTKTMTMIRIITQSNTYEFEPNLLSKFQEYLALEEIFAKYIIKVEEKKKKKKKKKVEEKKVEEKKVEEKNASPTVPAEEKKVEEELLDEELLGEELLGEDLLDEDLLDEDLLDEDLLDEVEEKEASPTVVKPRVYAANEMLGVLGTRFPDESTVTHKNNVAALNAILKVLGHRDVSIEYFLDAKDVINTLKTKTKVQASTLKRYFHVIKKLFTLYDFEYPDEYYDEIGRLKDEIDSNKSFNASGKEKFLLQWLDKNEDRLRQRLTNSVEHKTAKWTHFQRLCLFSLHIDFPCFRREWAAIICTTKDIDDGVTNYYNRTTSKICLNSFKNKSDWKPQMVCFLNKYPTAYRHMVEHLKHHPRAEGDTFALFLNVRLKPLKQTSFNAAINRIFDNKPISVNILRKYYVNKHIYTGTHTPAEVAEIHRVMNHTANTALNEYSKSY